MKDDVLALSTRLVRAMHQAERALSDDIREKALLHIADAIGIAVAARQSALAKIVVDGQYAACGKGDSKIIGGGCAAPIGTAFINAALIHILDFDDIHDVGRLHPGTVVIPAVLAAAEISGASQTEVVQAIALGFEMVCRLGVICSPQGSGPGSDWFLTQLLGYLAASYAAGKVLHLSEQQLVSSIGLAYMQAAGGKQPGFGVGSNSRAIYPAFAAQGGLQAALLARAGMIGPEHALDGAANLFKLYLSASLDESQVNALLDMSTWHFLDVDMKPWPCCRLSHPYIAVSLMARQACLQYRGASIHVAVNASAARLCRPLPERRCPVTLQDAKYSIPFMTAYALVHGEPSLSKLGEDILRDPEVLAMAARIEIEETLPDNPGHPLAKISLVENGETLLHHTFDPSALKMDHDRAKEKFLRCFDYAGISQQAEQAWNAVMDGRLLQALVSSAVVKQDNRDQVVKHV